MNIFKIDFTLKYNSLDIYLAGCNATPKCTNCHNPELWGFLKGKNYKEHYNNIEEKINDYPDLIDNIMLFGGDPMDQDMTSLIDLIQFLNQFDVDLWMFTRYKIDQIPKYIRNELDYIKTGRYLPEYKTDDNIQYGMELATSNQKVHKIK
jgi:anaerobic ribonucleoside-triphosphate reductase activating protein